MNILQSKFCGLVASATGETHADMKAFIQDRNPDEDQAVLDFSHPRLNKDLLVGFTNEPFKATEMFLPRRWLKSNLYFVATEMFENFYADAVVFTSGTTLMTITLCESFSEDAGFFIRLNGQGHAVELAKDFVRRSVRLPEE